MFEHEMIKGATEYITEVTEDTISASFSHPLFSQKDSSTATLISGFRFGKKYLWRYARITGNTTGDWHGPYNFEIRADTTRGTQLQHLHVLVNEEPNAGGIITLDCTHFAINRKGESVWYIPLAPDMTGSIKWVRDMKITPYGTVTFITDTNIFECDLRGNILWKGPNDGAISGDKTEYYHHDFKRLPNSHYMVLGNKYEWRVIPEFCDITKQKRAIDVQVNDHKLCAKVEYATLLEYDQQGKLVWSWDSKSYLKDTDVFACSSAGDERNFTGHANSFTLDATGKSAFIGFRDISRIIKIDRSTGKVEHSWGLKMWSGEAELGNTFFRKQHDTHLMTGNMKGAMAVFNNQPDTAKDKNSSVVIFSQPQPGNPGKILWEYECVLDSAKKTRSMSGGNIEELPDKNLLVCTGASNRIFEVTMDKHIVWSEELQRGDLLNIAKGAGSKFTQLYRAHYISSLYPCYFTAQVNKDTVTKNQPVVQLKIFNKGSEEDAYIIDVTAADTPTRHLKTTLQVSAGKSYSIELNTADYHKEVIEIQVRSVTNPALTRSLTVHCK